jgi:hypothetical protein
MDLAEPFAETLVARRERSLIDRRLLAIASFARVVGHAFDTRDRSGKIATAPPPQGRADHTDRGLSSQEFGVYGQILETSKEIVL